MKRYSRIDHVGRCHGGTGLWSKWRVDLLFGVRVKKKENEI